MNRLKQLYQEMILEHNKNPRNFAPLTDATCQVHGKNPLCGDDYQLYIRFNQSGQLEALGFTGNGCAISKSSASIMTTLLTEKTPSEAKEIKDAFLNLLMKENPISSEHLTPQLKVFEGVKQYPARVKCATLIWRALEKALEDPSFNGEVSTE